MERLDVQKQPLLLTVPEVARMLSIGSTRVRMLVASGTIPSVRIGRSVRIPEAGLYAWLKQCEQGAGISGEQPC